MLPYNTRRLEVAGNYCKTPFGGLITCVSRFRPLLPAIFHRWGNTNIFRKRSDRVLARSHHFLLQTGLLQLSRLILGDQRVYKGLDVAVQDFLQVING